MSIEHGTALVLSAGEDADGDPFGFPVKKSSGLFDDVIVKEVPHLAIVSFEDFARVGAMRRIQGDSGNPKGYSLHPLRGKWECPRCGSTNLHIQAKQHWMRCGGAVARFVTKEQATCDAPPVDLAAAENLFFRALETFAPGREENFAALARERYDEVLRGGQAERKQASERAQYLRDEIRSVSRELRKEQDNLHVRASLQQEADELGAELDELHAKLQDMPSVPEDPDPEESLFDLNNMIEKIKVETPFGFAVNVEALQFRSRLHDVLLGVTMVEKGDDVYDVEFLFDTARALDAYGRHTEIVRFKDQNLRAGRFEKRRKHAAHERRWLDGDYAISDRAWKKRPALPVAERVFGGNVRWMVDTMILTAETGVGTRTAVKISGDEVPHHIVQIYRGSAECAGLRKWLQDVRPRKHEYARMRPNPKAPTLRERMERAGGHPLLELDRVHPSAPPSPLTDAEAAGLFAVLDEVVPGYYPSMRARVDETLEIIRANHHDTWGCRPSHNIWYNYQVKRGTFLKIVNFLRSLEGKPACSSLPDVPKGRILKKKDCAAPGGVSVYPDDVMFGDAEAVIVITRKWADEIADEAVAMDAQEEFLKLEIETGAIHVRRLSARSGNQRPLHPMAGQ